MIKLLIQPDLVHLARSFVSKPLPSLAPSASTTRAQQQLQQPQHPDRSRSALTSENFHQLYKGHIVTIAEQMQRSNSPEQSEQREKLHSAVAPRTIYKLPRSYKNRDGSGISGGRVTSRTVNASRSTSKWSPSEEVHFLEMSFEVFQRIVMIFLQNFPCSHVIP
ncbi:unnamed protein product [Gongylonema pulchrum]|uniref:Uncharacterized protein n=1 Tax=Gongylonema pulchrum TaxID=637853 RepID=A0A183F1D8_9BILA|nr:unnamed protein product [Gongylonema pulchrum]